MKDVRVGFTGTRKGMTEKQKQGFLEQMAFLYPYAFHHGDCVGADAQAHDLVRKYFERVKIIVHPPTVEIARAFKKADRAFMPVSYLQRNQDIVDMCDVVIAAPETKDEVQRSGTWATIRYAWKKEKRCIILTP